MPSVEKRLQRILEGFTATPAREVGCLLGCKLLHFFSPCNPAAAVVQYEQPPLWLVVIGSLLALIGV